ncbi:MAG: CHAT domain-containing protein [Deltaproteobacteria bacterium]|nr:MAG: CHAT domain-containing protein [Deltaproteobacteria bacterium]
MHAGYFDAANQELDRAAQQLSADRDLAQVWYARGMYQREVIGKRVNRSKNELSVAALERSLLIGTRAGFTALVVNIHVSLAYSLAELDRTSDAERHLAEAGTLDVDGRLKMEREQVAARIAYHRGNLMLAYSLNEKLYPLLDDPDEQIDICMLQARIAIVNNDWAKARSWAQRGVKIVEEMSTQWPTELRSWILANRREPFELLVTALARAHAAEEAILVLDQWQRRTLLDQMVLPSPDPPRDLASAAAKVRRLLGSLLPASKAPLMAGSERAVLQSLRTIDLVSIVVSEGQVWRVSDRHGRFSVDQIAPFDMLRDRLSQFAAMPADPELASDLGVLILPSDFVHATEDPLYVVLDARLAAMPFAALRSNGQPLIVTRPVLLMPRLPVSSSCESDIDNRRVMVLADPMGDLPAARRESSHVASLFATTPIVGVAATSSALFAARSDMLLHLVVHVDVDAGGGTLRLHDRTISAPQICGDRLGPRLVVLSATGSANSWNPELASSLSTAFLTAGSQYVVTALKPMSDAGSLELMNRFYKAGGARDPVHALAQVQVALFRIGNTEWQNVFVFGRNTCEPHP